MLVVVSISDQKDMLFKAAGMAQVRRDDDTPVRAFLRAKFNDKALLMPVTNSYLH